MGKWIEIKEIGAVIQKGIELYQSLYEKIKTNYIHKSMYDCG